MSIIVNLKYDDLKNFIKVTTSFKSDIDMIKGHYIVDAKSIMGVLSLDFTNDIEVKINTDDKDEIIKFEKEMEEFK